VARPLARLQAIFGIMLLALLVLLGRAAEVQVVQGHRWAALATAARTERVVLPARRGTLSDRRGAPIAVTQETYHVGIAPNELKDPAGDGQAIGHALRLSTADLRRALRQRYAYFGGPYGAAAVEPIRTLRGVHLEPVLNRFYPSPGLAGAVIGRVDDDGRGASGLERTLDSLVAGVPGSAVVLKDRAGREYVSPARVIASCRRSPSARSMRRCAAWMPTAAT